MPKTPIPRALKAVTPFIRRADELDRAGGDLKKMAAYIVRSWAIEVGIKHNDKSEEVQAFLLSLMDRLEQDKQVLPSFKTTEEAKKFMEEFALGVFKKADDVDRAGKANKSTAKTFYAADTFFQTLRQFDDNRELDPDIQETALYAKFKATDIIKAIKEGRKPTPGPPGGDDNNDDDGMNGNNGGNGGGGGGGVSDAPLFDIPSAPLGLGMDSINTATPAPTPQMPLDDPDAARAAALAASLADAEQAQVVEPPPPAYVPPPAAPKPQSKPKPQPRREPEPKPSMFGRLLGRGNNSGGSSNRAKPSEDNQIDVLEYAKYGVRALELEQWDKAEEYLANALNILRRR